jgi:predicted SnoaL-like aldol condensation-catalyzing enzyme
MTHSVYRYLEVEIMSAAKLVNEYLQAFYSGDFGRAGALVSDDFHFKGPFVEVANKEAFFSSAARLAPIVKGHRLLRQWEDGDEVSSVYEVNLETPAGSGAVTMSEWHAVRHAKLISGRIIFDTAAFRALVPPK